MTQAIEHKTGLCVIGAGPAGLAVTSAAAALGVPTILIERGAMGGARLNHGALAAASLRAAGQAIADAGHAAAFGIEFGPPRIDRARLATAIRATVDALAPADAAQRMAALGAIVLTGTARFTAPNRVQVGDTGVTARRFVIATGARAIIPEIPGLAQIPYLTPETLLAHPAPPERLIILGGNPLALELAQAYRRLGSAVTLVAAGNLLPDDEPELVDQLRGRLQAEGMRFYEGAAIRSAVPSPGGVRIVLDCTEIEAGHLLIALGRAPDLDGLNLGAAGIAASPRGIQIDRGLRTSNRRVFAIGDAVENAGGIAAAGEQAALVLKRALFRLPGEFSPGLIPRATQTDPALAQVGLTEAAARAAGHTVNVLRWPLAENDRARTARRLHGLVKVVTDRRGRILGAGILGNEAGELIAIWQMAIAQGLKIGAVAGLVTPYPAYGEISKRAAGSFVLPRLLSERSKRLVRLLARLA